MCNHSDLRKGDRVQIQGQERVGEIAEIVGSKASITLEYVTITLPLKQVQRVDSSTKATTAYHSTQASATRVINLSVEAFSNFNPEIDLHGMYVEEALEAIDKWIDKASLLGHKYLKVIHGRGSGILRQAIRAYLQAHVLVKRVIQQHPFRGADGITLVEL